MDKRKIKLIVKIHTFSSKECEKSSPKRSKAPSISNNLKQ